MPTGRYSHSIRRMRILEARSFYGIGGFVGSSPQ